MTDTHFGHGNYGAGDEQALIDEVNRLEPEFVIITGDVMEDGVFADYAKGFVDQIEVPCYPMEGNHDNVPTDWLLRDFSFVHSGIRFIGFFGWVFDIIDWEATTAQEHIDFLEAELEAAAAAGEIPIVLNHYALLNIYWGHYGADHYQPELLALLAQHNVPLYLHGHAHDDFLHQEQDGTMHISGGPTCWGRQGLEKVGFMMCYVTGDNLHISYCDARSPFGERKTLDVELSPNG